MKYQINPKYAHFKEFLLGIKEHFSANNKLIHDARNQLKILEFEGETVVVKSFKVPHLLNRIVYSYFRDTKAKKSYEYSLKLEALGISTPEPIAYIEFYESGLLQESYFINKHINYDFTIREIFNDTSFFEREKILEEFAEFTYNLHEKGVLHLDYSPGNILIKKDVNSYNFYLVDINRMKFQTLSKEQRFQNFSKLWAHTEDLTLIAKSYAEISSYDALETTKEILKYNNNNKRTKNFKKRFKNYKA